MDDGSVNKQGARKSLVLTIRDKPIFLEEDWESGIGGRIRSMGLACRSFSNEHAVDVPTRRFERQGFRIRP